MNEEQQEYQRIRRLNVVLVIIAALCSILIFGKSGFTIGAGVVIGGCAGILGFNSIIRMSEKVSGELQDASRFAYTRYMRRYLMYTVIFALAVWRGIHPIALLAGYLCNKLAILIDTVRYKEGG